MNEDISPHRVGVTGLLWGVSTFFWILTTVLALLCPLWVTLVEAGVAVMFTAFAVKGSVFLTHQEWDEWIDREKVEE